MTSMAAQAVQAAQTATVMATDAYAVFHAQQCDTILGPIDAADATTDPTLLKDMMTAAELSAAMYSYRSNEALPENAFALSVGLDDRPDCVAHWSDGGDGMWIAVRGTQTLQEDVLHDASWCVSTATVGGVDVPIAVVKKCEIICRSLALQLEGRGKRLRRIRFTGHSLGGAIATGLLLAFTRGDDMTATCRTLLARGVVDCDVFTFAAPLVLSQPPAPLLRELNDDAVSRRVHNIVTQLDVVPRLLGAHPLPTYITDTDVGAMVHNLMTSSVHRETYRPMGSFYSLREASSSGYLLGRMRDPAQHLRLFPRNTIDFAFAVARDHSMDRTLIAMRAAVASAGLGASSSSK